MPMPHSHHLDHHQSQPSPAQPLFLPLPPSLPPRRRFGADVRPPCRVTGVGGGCIWCRVARMSCRVGRRPCRVVCRVKVSQGQSCLSWLACVQHTTHHLDGNDTTTTTYRHTTNNRHPCKPAMRMSQLGRDVCPIRTSRCVPRRKKVQQHFSGYASLCVWTEGNRWWCVVSRVCPESGFLVKASHVIASHRIASLGSSAAERERRPKKKKTWHRDDGYHPLSLSLGFFFWNFGLVMT